MYGWEVAYSANKDKSRIALMENVLIQIWHSVVSNWDMRKERERPGVSSPYDESINIFNRAAINEVSCSACDMRDRWLQ
jgi:hypothetical protein